MSLRKTKTSLLQKVKPYGPLKHKKWGWQIYKRYHDIKTRCYNTKCQAYGRYGGRGIRMCDRWKNDIHSFYNWCMTNGFKPSLSIDRTDNDGDYTPLNCKFVSAKEQSRNRRSNLLFKGEYAHDASKRLGLTRGAVSSRVKSGWTTERAFTTPKTKKRFFHKGVSATEAEKRLRLKPSSISYRISQLGWSIHRAFTTPKKNKTS